MDAIVTRRLRHIAAICLGVALTVGCATGRAFSKGQAAQKNGDWDTAVMQYREALGHDPSRVEIKIALALAMRQAAVMHDARAKQLEAQDQLQGAAAEYHLAADVDPSDQLAAAKAAELDRKIRDRIEAARPKSKLEELKAQAAQAPVIPVLDPRIRVTQLQFSASTNVKDELTVIAARTGINIVYDQSGGANSMAGPLGQGYAINLQDASLEQALNQILSANTLFFKVVDPKTVMVIQDTPANRTKFEEQAFQTFYVSSANIADVSQMLTQMTTGLSTLPVRPTIVTNKLANSITVKASLSTLAVIDKLIRANDKPRVELVFDVEILEVDRKHLKQYGITFNNSNTIGATFSPGSAAAAGTVTNPPTPPPSAPPINANTISNGVSLADLYLSIPSVQLQLLESDSKTKILAKPQLQGVEGQALTMNLGSKVPVLNASTPTVAAGGIAAAPTTSYTYTPVGVNLTINPTVTANDEILLDLTVENSSLGDQLSVAGTLIPEITDRIVHTFLRLRDGESNLLAGLLSQTDHKTQTGFPGVNQIPLLRSLFGGTNNEYDQTDIVMAITPHIVKGHELTVDDLKPIYVGNNTNFGLTGPPSLIAPPETPPTSTTPATTTATLPAPAGPASGLGTAAGATGATGAMPIPAPGAAGATNPTVVPTTPAAPTPAPPSTPPAPQTTPAQVTLVPPGTEFSMGGGPYNVPVLISNVSQLGSLTLTVTYDPKVLRVQSVSLGNAMQQGGVTPSFTPKIDPAGRVDIVITRPSGTAPVNLPAGTQGVLAGLVFEPVAAGASPITLAGVAMTSTGTPISLNFISTNVTVK